MWGSIEADAGVIIEFGVKAGSDGEMNNLCFFVRKAVHWSSKAIELVFFFFSDFSVVVALGLLFFFLALRLRQQMDIPTLVFAFSTVGMVCINNND